MKGDDIKAGSNFILSNNKGRIAPAVAAKVAKAEDGKCAFSGKAASKESKVTIAVCCGKCEKKGKADPKALLAKLQKKKK